jgi:glycosyltransferase involved in cell wall biosynthesis
MSAPPLVTIVVPAYNAERYLSGALRSILDQEFDDFEVIVVDDGSIDDTAAVAACHTSVSVLQQPNGGVARARNAGIEASRGRFVAFLDSDDLWLPQKLSLQVELVRSEPAPDYVLGKMQCFVDDGFAPPAWIRRSMFTPQLAHSTGTILAKRSAFDRVGGFDPDTVPAETVDWFARAADAGLQGSAVDALILLRRFHEANSAAYGVHALNAQLLGVVRRSIERKRNIRVGGAPEWPRR